MTIDLSIPSFLIRPKSNQPLALKLAYVNGNNHWRHSRPKRPEGATWETAQLREIFFRDEARPIGAGLRLVWVREGRRWCKLCSTDGTKSKITMAAWKLLARSARRVEVQ